MALSKRNSQPITVDDVEFRWTVASRSQATTGLVTVVVQPPQNGCRLAVAVPCQDYWLNTRTHPTVPFNVHAITPGFVRQLVDEAQSIGWQPYSSASQFNVNFACAIVRGDADGTTSHASWQCPDCEKLHSEDIQSGQQSPLMSSCGRTKHHSTKLPTHVILFW